MKKTKLKDFEFKVDRKYYGVKCKNCGAPNPLFVQSESKVIDDSEGIDFFLYCANADCRCFHSYSISETVSFSWC